MSFDSFEIAFEQEQDDESTGARSPTLLGSVSSGKTIEEAQRNIREAIQQHLEASPAYGYRIALSRMRGSDTSKIGTPALP